MKRYLFGSRNAVTLTELLVVLAILALLATLAVPVYLNQLNRAKIAVAQAETREIAEAMQYVAITHGFLVPIHVLDNIRTPNSDSASLFGPSSNRDDFAALNRATTYVIDTTVPLVNQRGANQLTFASSNNRVERMIAGWEGPFLNPKRVRYRGEDPANPAASVDISEDLVVDPWGNPYRVYSPFGLLGSDQRTPREANFTITIGMSDLQLGSSNREAGRFDRYAIVSYGPDGDTGYENDNPAYQGDDLYYAFSAGIIAESVYHLF
jgi:prepilin-type N-terminal cleavage/methylation domain-containing protein